MQETSKSKWKISNNNNLFINISFAPFCIYYLPTNSKNKPTNFSSQPTSPEY